MLKIYLGPLTKVDFYPYYQGRSATLCRSRSILPPSFGALAGLCTVGLYHPKLLPTSRNNYKRIRCKAYSFQDRNPSLGALAGLCTVGLHHPKLLSTNRNNGKRTEYPVFTPVNNRIPVGALLYAL